MKKIKLFIAGKVRETKAGVRVIESEVQKDLDSVFGANKIGFHIDQESDNSWKLKFIRTYDAIKEQYSIPTIYGAETKIDSMDADLLAGNYTDLKVNFGLRPFGACNYFRYIYGEKDFLLYWNKAAKEQGFSKVKKVHFTNDFDQFEVRFEY